MAWGELPSRITLGQGAAVSVERGSGFKRSPPFQQGGPRPRRLSRSCGHQEFRLLPKAGRVIAPALWTTCMPAQHLCVQQTSLSPSQAPPQSQAARG